MMDIKHMVSQADDLRGQASHESDPNVRDLLNRMADAYSDIADTEAGTIPASLYGLMGIFTQRESEGSPKKTH